MSRPESFLEARFALHLKIYHKTIPPCVREYCFDDARKWRFDFAWPEQRIAVEVEGKVHTLKSAHENDCCKFAVALLSGWKVLRVSYAQVRDESAIRWLEQLFQTI